uniref:Transposase n=1 Tax=Heterorhabditis bacteriophora TaxID=37862 RepID=A0A1I7XEU6_HETBA
MLLKHANRYDLYSVKVYRFRRFKAGDFDVSDRRHSGIPQTLKTDPLEALLRENPLQARKGLA